MVILGVLIIFAFTVMEYINIKIRNKNNEIFKERLNWQDKKLDTLIESDGQRKLSMELMHQKLNDLPDKNAKICRDETAKNFYYILTGMERR